jgi:hypothetical protein
MSSSQFDISNFEFGLDDVCSFLPIISLSIITVIATVTSQLWCFPKRVQVLVIPRFKIVDVAFSLGPRSIPLAAMLFMLLGLILAILGGVGGGCPAGCNPAYYFTCTGSLGTCAMMVIGILLLLIPVPLLLLLHFIRKHHYIYLDVKTSPKYLFGYGGIKSHTFCFKNMGFNHATDEKATFDQYYLVEYVYGSLAHAGNVVTNEAQLLSHYNHAALCTPIIPIHADNTVGDRSLPSLLQCRNNHNTVTKLVDV